MTACERLLIGSIVAIIIASMWWHTSKIITLEERLYQTQEELSAVNYEKESQDRLLNKVLTRNECLSSTGNK